MMRHVRRVFWMPLILIAHSVSSQLIWSESFETDGNGTRYTPSVEASPTSPNASCNDYFFRSLSNDDCQSDEDIPNLQSGPFTNFDGNYAWHAEDLDDNGVGGNGNFIQTITFNNIPNISSYSTLTFSGDFGSGNTVFDNNTAAPTNPDFMIIEYQVDDSGFQELLAFHPTLTIPGVFNTNMALDTNGDDIGDGEILDSELSKFSEDFSVAGSQLDIKITVSANSGNEELAFDNFQIEIAEALPVSLEYFELKKLGTSVGIFWSTLQEINHSHFIIQHSVNGSDWNEIIDPIKKEESNGNRNYSLIHYDPHMK